ncbi:histidine phosphatase family protein [Actinobacteria bacterium YIM 96077]|uniref:Histidine phosphatase family protein n=1 Tax=Phytoactinopolyspora halophila TaxID=1981511 RepID=A0A329QLP1_9ACTN|nr:histidine phosphatase family protein [Actinobacteria bacterium YIM 96077]RAW13295.1 histidine phosphatase family protein [Phytoactinopolyspora halophila]
MLRHAKSAWPDEDVSDRERPLTTRGGRDAAAVGRWLRDQALAPQLALVSGARRTRETYDGMAGELDPAPELQVADAAYAAGTGDLLDLVRDIPDDVSSAILIGHNPGIATLASLIDDEATDVPERQQMRLNFRTAACAVFEVDGHWSGIDPGTARLVAFAVPRG